MDAPASWRGVTGPGHAREHSGAALGVRHTGHVDFTPYAPRTRLSIVLGAAAGAWLALAALVLVGSMIIRAVVG